MFCVLECQTLNNYSFRFSINKYNSLILEEALLVNNPGINECIKACKEAINN